MIDARLTNNQFSFHNTIKDIIQGCYWHLWYLYAYIALIFTLPFLRKFVRGLDNKSFIYLFSLAVIIKGFIPIIEYFVIGIHIQGYLQPTWIVSDIFIYPVTGYMIDQKIDLKYVQNIHIMIGWLINVLCIIGSGICEYFFLIKEPNSVAETFLMNFCLINASVLFMTIKYLFAQKKLNDVTHKIITEIGQCTFGIYLLHILFLWRIPFFYNLWLKIESRYSSIGIFISCFLVFCISGIVTNMFRKLHITKKLF